MNSECSLGKVGGVMDLMKKMQQEIFTDSEQAVINYIMQHSENILDLSIYQLAKLSCSSTSTIVRVCKKLDFNGFKDFKTQLFKELKNQFLLEKTVDVNLPFQRNDSDYQVSLKIAQLTLESISQTQTYLNEKILQQSVDLLINAPTLIGIGISQNHVRLQEFQMKLLPIGRYIRLVNSQAEQFHLANNGNKDDVVLIISYSGKTADVVNEARMFHENGSKIIAITSNIKSPLAEYADLILDIPKFENLHFKVSNFSSQIAIEYILNVLYSCIYKRNFDMNYASVQLGPDSTFLF